MHPTVFRTSEVADAAGVHPNTVRLYEEWGFLQPVARNESGYRLYTQEHVDQMRLARAAMHGPWPGQRIRESALALVRRAAGRDLHAALEQAREHLQLVQDEQARAELAASLVQRWADGALSEPLPRPLSMSQAAAFLDLTSDTIRGWEREGLLRVPRDPANGYRRYGAMEIDRLRVIRMLRLAGYSTMAILRMMLQLDAGRRDDLRTTLDTPRPDEDVYTAADQWLTALSEQEQRAQGLIQQIEAMLGSRS